MARLPEPVLESVKVKWPSEKKVKRREREFYGILGIAIKRAVFDEPKESNKS